MNRMKIVAVSGGVDSMALLHMLQTKTKDLVVAHVNYNQRTTSKRDEALLRKYCLEHNLKLEVKQFDIDYKGNFQSVARNFRYDFFKYLYDKYEADTLFLGHHLDDDLETFIMQQNSNRKTKSMGIKEKTEIKGMVVERPLLNLTKKEIIEYCILNNVPYEDDESNFELDYTRNKTRYKISQLSKESKDDYLNELKKAKELKENYNDKIPTLPNPFNIDSYLLYPKEQRQDALRYFLGNNGVNPHGFTKSYLENLDQLITSGKAQHPIQDMNLSISYNEVYLHGDLSFSYTINDLETKETIHYKLKDKGQVIEGVTLHKEDFPLTIRSPHKGDKIELRFGSKSINRFFIDRKIPTHKRKSWLLVENSVKDIVFVMGIGCDIHHYSNNPTVYMVK